MKVVLSKENKSCISRVVPVRQEQKQNTNLQGTIQLEGSFHFLKHAIRDVALESCSLDLHLILKRKNCPFFDYGIRLESVDSQLRGPAGNPSFAWFNLSVTHLMANAHVGTEKWFSVI